MEDNYTKSHWNVSPSRAFWRLALLDLLQRTSGFDWAVKGGFFNPLSGVGIVISSLDQRPLFEVRTYIAPTLCVSFYT
jgi:hypothetical protein